MSVQSDFRDLGIIDYKEAWDLQEQLFEEVVATKLFNREHPESKKVVVNHLLFCEHPHVFTLGKSGAPSNLLITDELLKTIDAQFYKINRGGDITYHGPGQIVGYPIFDLEVLGLGIREYIHLLEQSIISALADMGIVAGRLEGATGVWLDVDQPQKARKISAIGVRASRFVSMHGFALNVNTNLDYFRHINPCGFIDKGVTSLEKELGAPQSMEKVKALLHEKLSAAFGLSLIQNSSFY
jgi:lipoyl(octanoyl) transferase